ncbi:MAG: hypothetical protein Q4E53_11600 [Eubacteriales bacterium]|nr:hypothetical protein [Eubacteriales bacterium]
MNEKREYPTMKKMMKQGQIMVVYGSKYLVSVNPILTIERIRFSVVKLETKGKDVFNFYLTVEQMRQFCEEIDRGIALKKILQDTSNYPTAYRWVNGVDGSKQLIIGGGEKGIRVQTSGKREDGSGVDRRMTIIQHDDLKQMSFLFKLITGLITVTPDSYYDELRKAFLDAAKERERNMDTEKEENACQYASEAIRVHPEETGNRVVDRQPFEKQKNNVNPENRKVVVLKIVSQIQRDPAGIVRCTAVANQKRFTLCFNGNALIPDVKMNADIQAEVLTKKDIMNP